MISRSVLLEHVEQETKGTISTPQQEVACEIATLLGNGSSVEEILEVMYHGYAMELDHHKEAAYIEAVCFIEGLKPEWFKAQNITRKQVADHIMNPEKAREAAKVLIEENFHATEAGFGPEERDHYHARHWQDLLEALGITEVFCGLCGTWYARGAQHDC